MDMYTFCVPTGQKSNHNMEKIHNNNHRRKYLEQISPLSANISIYLPYTYYCIILPPNGTGGRTFCFLILGNKKYVPLFRVPG